MESKFAVLSGTPVLGYEITGPFDSRDKASAWADEEFEGEPFWWVLSLESPDYEPCMSCSATAPCDCEVTEALTDLPMMGEGTDHAPRKLRVLPAARIEDLIPGVGSQLRVIGT